MAALVPDQAAGEHHLDSCWYESQTAADRTTQYKTTYRQLRQVATSCLVPTSGLRESTQRSYQDGYHVARRLRYVQFWSEDKIWCEDDACQQEGESVFKRFSRRVYNMQWLRIRRLLSCPNHASRGTEPENSTSQIKEPKHRDLFAKR